MLKEYNVSPPFLELAKLPSFLCLLSLSELIHSLNKLPFEQLPACLIFLPEIKFGLIAFDLGLIVLIKRGPLDPLRPFSKWITAYVKSYNICKVQLSAKPTYVITIQLYLKTPSKTWQDWIYMYNIHPFSSEQKY